MSVNSRRQDINVAPRARPRPNYPFHPPEPPVFLDIPTQLPYQSIVGPHFSWPSTVYPPPHFFNNRIAHFHHFQSPMQRADQDFQTNPMFNRYHQDADIILNNSKQSLPLSINPQAMPINFSFRPWDPNDGRYMVPLQTEQPVPAKVESTPELPTPAVLSTHVDVSQYEVLPHGEWLKGTADYTGVSPYSDDSFEGPSFSEDMDLDEHDGHIPAGEWARTIDPAHHAPYLSTSFSSTDDSSYGSPALSYDGSSGDPATSSSFSSTMFGFPEVVPPSRFGHSHRTYRPVAATAAADIERPSSGYGNETESILRTMPERHPEFPAEEEEEEYANRRDKMLMEMRSKGHSYKEIKRLGHLKEAESTLRGRLRTLTKEKSERVRKPKWSEHDIKLLQDGVAHFVDLSSGASKRRKSFRKLPWKKISLWMKENGSSYLFAPATCAKKWDEI